MVAWNMISVYDGNLQILWTPLFYFMTTYWIPLNTFCFLPFELFLLADLLNYDSIHYFSLFHCVSVLVLAYFNQATSDVQSAVELFTLSAWKIKYFIGITNQASSNESLISVLCYVLLCNSKTMNHNIHWCSNWTMLSQFHCELINHMFLLDFSEDLF